MGSQRSYSTIKERLKQVFENKMINPDKAKSFFRGLYPVGSDLVALLEVIGGMINFIKENIELYEIDNEDFGTIDFRFVEDDVCQISYAIALGDYTVYIYNFKYTNTTTLDIRKEIDGKYSIITVTPKNYLDFKYFIDRCAYTLIDILHLVYIRRWRNG